jgi:purine-nucleoside phosphorylase
MDNAAQAVLAAANAIKSAIGTREPVQTAIVLGSGLGGLAESMTEKTIVPFAKIPGFGSPILSGHCGNVVYGKFSGKPLLCMQGRLHYYEGYPFAQVVLPVRTLFAMGVRTLILTNAAGGINQSYQIGDILCINDHINFMGGNPLAGNHDPAFGEHFFDMGEAYSKRLRTLAHQAAHTLNIRIHDGVYVSVAGPSYETPAEIRAFRVLGADAVGMSTVPEVIAARQCGIEVLALSMITNMAAGVTQAMLSGKDVLDTGALHAQKMEQIIATVLQNL